MKYKLSTIFVGALTGTLVLVSCASAPPEPTAASQVVSVPTETPTEPLAPTITRLPLQTPLPTPRAPSSSAAAPSSSSPQADAYLKTREDQFNAAAKAVGDLEQGLASAQSNPSLLTDSSWQASTAASVAALKSVSQQIGQTHASSADLADLDTWFATASQDLTGAADAISAALGSRNPQAIQQASSLLPKADVDLQHVNQLLNEAKQKYGVAATGPSAEQSNRY
jgi:hypothetical protein